MGLCTSCDAAVGHSSTAKLILDNGMLLEFDRPVRAGSAVGDTNRWFVCDADEMEIDALVSAVRSDELLRPGQIYFVLPKSMLKSPLQADEMAKLAVKASAALVNNSRPRGKSSVAPLMFEPKEDAVVPTAGKRRVGGGRGRKFATHLTAIQELEEMNL